MEQLPFVGRETELRRLRAFWADAAAGRTRVCVVTGEAGAGKSTLVSAFAAGVQAEDARVVVAVGNCDAQTGQSDAYLPFLTLLSQLTGDLESRASRGPGGSENARRLHDLVRVSARTLVEYAPALVGTLVPGGSLLASVGKFAAKEAGLLRKLDEKLAAPETQGPLDQERICQQYTELLKRLSEHCPLIVVLDDMQWADTASIQLFFHLSRALSSEPILLVATYRPNDVAIGRGGERHPLESVLNEMKRYLGDVWVDLDSAGPDDRRALVWALVDAEPNALGEDFRRGLLEHTGGHPLFVVELLRSLQERGHVVRDAEGRWTASDTLDWGGLPSRVEGVVEERIGRLENDLREILTVASVEGTSFTTQIIAQLREMRERELLRVVSGELEKRHRLVVEGATERVGGTWVSQFAFSHVLFQQYLYNDLSGRERMLLHGEVAEMLEKLYAGHTERVAVQLARHYDLAGEPERAIDYQLLAASRALSMSAYVESRALLDRARALLEEVPAGPERSRRELEILNRLCNVINAIEGWDSPALVELYRRSRELCQELGERAQLSRVLFGLWTYHLVKMELEQSRVLAQEFFDLADALAERDCLLQAHAVMANSLFWLGRVAEANEYAQAALDLYDPEVQEAHLARYGQDARVLPLMFLAYTEWLLGHPDRARGRVEEALRVARGISHPFSLAFALYTAGYLDHLLREPEAALSHAEELLRLCEEHQFPFYRGLATTLRGWAVAMTGRPAEGIEQVREGFRTWASFGARINHSVYALMLSEAHLRDGDPTGALEVADTGLAVAQQCSELAYEAELLRLRGEALAALPGRTAEAEASLARAVERAREQGLPALELRAAASLARLRCASGRPEGVRELLEAPLGRVPGGQGTRDLQEARALLDALSPPPLLQEAVP